LLYLDCMCEQAARLVACTVGVDQALHNYIVHNRLVPATVHAFGEGGAINLNATRLASLDMRNGRMYGRDGQLLAIVHQYDRVPGLKLNSKPASRPELSNQVGTNYIGAL